MAPLTVHGHLFPREGVQLGRLVTNVTAPQSFYYPTGKRRLLKGDVYSVPSRDFHALNTKSKNTKLEAVLASVASIIFGSTDDLETKISNTVCITYYLDNADVKFAAMCRDKTARAWFEKAYKRRKHVYMVTAIQTLTGASMELKGSKSTDVSASGTVPLSKAAGDPTPTGIGDLRLLAELRQSKHIETGFVAEGEQIYAIQYRKVKFDLFSSRDMGEAYLEEGNRWKVMWKTMGVTPAGTNDALEATLADPDEPLEEEDGVETCNVDGLGVFHIVKETMNDGLKI
jgi:hypothetical protein